MGFLLGLLLVCSSAVLWTGFRPFSPPPAPPLVRQLTSGFLIRAVACLLKCCSLDGLLPIQSVAGAAAAAAHRRRRGAAASADFLCGLLPALVFWTGFRPFSLRVQPPPSPPNTHRLLLLACHLHSQSLSAYRPCQSRVRVFNSRNKPNARRHTVRRPLPASGGGAGQAGADARRALALAAVHALALQRRPTRRHRRRLHSSFPACRERSSPRGPASDGFTGCPSPWF